jgi:ATPase subunit of ABC transporter with duplicated ATPase domains
MHIIPGGLTVLVVLVIVSHDKFFTDKVTDHLFVFEGNGAMKDYFGSLSASAYAAV